MATKPKPLRQQKAIDWLAAKQPLTKEQWDKISWDSARRAFMVSGVAKVDVVKAVRDAMVRNAKRGGNLESFRKMVEPMLRKEWQGTVANPAARIGTIYTTNMQAAYMAGRWQAMQRTKASKPFAIFNAVNDERTSDRCLRLNGLVASLDAWERRGYVPPLHFRCRSVLEPLPPKDAKKRGITARLPTVQVNQGFGSVSQADEWKPDLKSYPPDLRKFVKASMAASKQAQPAVRTPQSVESRNAIIANAKTKLSLDEYLKQHPVSIRFSSLNGRQASGVYNATKSSIRIKDPRGGKLGQAVDSKLHSISSAAATQEEAYQRTLIHELVHHVRKTSPSIAKAAKLHWDSGAAKPMSKVGKLNDSEYLSELMVASIFHPAETQKFDPKGFALAKDVLEKLRDPKHLMTHELPKPAKQKLVKPIVAQPKAPVVSKPGPVVAKPATPTVSEPTPAFASKPAKPTKSKLLAPEKFDFDKLEDGAKEFEKITTTGVRTMHSELYSKATGKMFPMMKPDEEAAAFAFSYQHDHVIRLLDRGKSRAEIEADYIKHMLGKAVPTTVTEADSKAFVEKCEGYRKKLYEMFDSRPKQPTPDGFVYRGMHSIKESTIKKFFESSMDLGAISSTTVSPNRAALFAADMKHKDVIDGERAYRVILKLKNKRGYSIQDASQFPSESEVLVPKAKYRILKAKKHRGSHIGTPYADWVIIEAEEIDE